MKKILLLLLCLMSFSQMAQAQISVFACEPEWGALVTELGGDKVDVFTATTAQQDPHHIQARPSLIARIRKTDLVVCTGAELEIGWLPVLIKRGSNPDVQIGKPGYFEAARFVSMLDVPQNLDRSEGDIHPQGNPHIHTNPHNILAIAKALGKRLTEIDPENQTYYQSRLDDFVNRWQAAIQNWENKASALKGTSIVVQHNSWPYLSQWLGLNVVAALEAKPGIPPSTADLSKILEQLKEKPAQMLIYAAYQDNQSSKWLTRHTDIKLVALPYTVGGSENASDLFKLFDQTIEKLLKGAQQ